MPTLEAPARPPTDPAVGPAVAESTIPDRHGFWGGGDRYPASEAEIRRFCNQSSW
jgi:hypothetical protein